MVTVESFLRLQPQTFQYSLCRVVLMVADAQHFLYHVPFVSVLALSSRFDGQPRNGELFIVVDVSVLALSSRFDGRKGFIIIETKNDCFSTRSVESF